MKKQLIKKKKTKTSDSEDDFVINKKRKYIRKKYQKTESSEEENSDYMPKKYDRIIQKMCQKAMKNVYESEYESEEKNRIKYKNNEIKIQQQHELIEKYKSKYINLKNNILQYKSFIQDCTEGFILNSSDNEDTNTFDTKQKEIKRDYKKQSNIKNNISFQDEIRLKTINKLEINDNSFYIIVMCTNKSIIKNSDDDAFRFFIDLKDDSGCIRILGFKKNHDAFHEQINKNEMYKIINPEVKKLNFRFNFIVNKSNCELRFSNNTIVEKCNSSITVIKKETIKLTEIKDIITKKKMIK